MTTRVDEYRTLLRELPTASRDELLLAESGLPGPRGNLELAAAVAEEGDAARFSAWARPSPEANPTASVRCGRTRAMPVGASARRWPWRSSGSAIGARPR